MSLPTTPAVTWTQPAPISPTTPLGAAQLDATASVPGNFQYYPSSGATLAAGTHTLTAKFTPVDSVHYTTASASVNIVVSGPEAPVITWPQPALILTSTPLSSVQLDATANVPGTFVYNPAAGSTLPPGTNTLNVTFTPTDLAHYAPASASVQIQVNAQQIPVLTWAKPADITQGTPLSSAQLDATANVPGTVTYTPAAGTVLPPGYQALNVKFTPTDTVNYSDAWATVVLFVQPSTQESACATSLSTGASDFLYVSNGGSNKGPAYLTGFSIAADGSLTAVPGSPYLSAGMGSLSTVGASHSLFGADGFAIYTYAIHSDGCLTLQNWLADGQGIPQIPYIGPDRLFLDRTASTLYSWDFVPPEEAYFASYNFDPSTGAVSRSGQTITNMLNDTGILPFSSDDRYAVTADILYRSGPAVSQFQRLSDGTLKLVSPAPLPATSGQYTSFYPYGAASDGFNHFIVPGYVCQGPPYCTSEGPWQLAVYSVDAAGNLVTSSTDVNMAQAPALTPNWGPNGMAFSPDSHYYAISGYSGIDVYAWDSAAATLTHIATIQNTQGTCTNTAGCSGPGYGTVAWDSHDHLITTFGNQVLVYNVTASAVTPAPGSPNTVQNPISFTIVPAASN